MSASRDVVALVGSLRQASWNRLVLRAVADRAPDGFSVELVELDGIPPYNSDLDAAGPPQPVADLKARVAAADAVIVNSPEYNFGISGVVKNALDWISRPAFEGPLLGKPTGVVAASPGSAVPERAAAQARLTAEMCGAVLPEGPDLTVSELGNTFDPADGLAPAVIEAVDGFVSLFAEFVAATLVDD